MSIAETKRYSYKFKIKLENYVSQDNLTSKQNDYAIFLPAISGFYATFVGKQRVANDYVDPARFPAGLTDMEQMNWLNDAKGLFPYKWSLYSGGHANLDLNKVDPSEDMVRNRDPNTLILGDSGGFQIAKGLWEGDWKAGSGCPKAQKKREQILKWLDEIADYGMILDIPTWVVHDKKASAACGISTHQEAVDATKFNNDYFMKHRKGIKNGGAKFLNVLQGANHTEADDWYQTMKHYCDPTVYPDTHFNGWSMGGQNMCDVHLILKRLVELRYDNLLQEGVHDWMHFLGTSKLEWAVLLTVIQRNVRKYVNPAFTISFDCASPFLATANGQVYFENVFPDNDKWSYRMAPSADDKKYATDTRKWSDGVVADGIYPRWENSPISDMLTMKDICIYKPGDLNKIGKEGKTSWDSFSYALLMGHNVWMHITAVQEANRRFDAGEHPAMMRSSGPGGEYFEHIVEAIFAAPTKQESLDIIEQYDTYWMEIVGTRGFKGKKTRNSLTNFNALFDFEESEIDESPDVDDEMVFDESKLDNLEAQ
ncbi:MAG TPA: hypothetical protein VFM18_18640 [Methanosarcina sp.]|nr:hypothetical protein [Methanosarcina sp.]